MVWHLGYRKQSGEAQDPIISCLGQIVSLSFCGLRGVSISSGLLPWEQR